MTTPAFNTGSSSFVELHKKALSNYYRAMLQDNENSAAGQETLNRLDLKSIAQNPWADLKDEERGLIALLCNHLL